MDESLYAGREQSLIKHLILEKYLLRFALIIGRHWKSITYVDCFSGPWKSKSENHDDTSFAIAVRELNLAKDKLAEEGKSLKLRSLFIEQDKQAFKRLEQYANSIEQVETKVINSSLEDSINQIAEFVGHSHGTFPFIFIDPTGWNGFALDVIRPLLQLEPSEVLINFMTQHIVRFIENEASQSSFEKMFGNSEFKGKLANLRGDDRVDAILSEYRSAVSQAGKFDYSGVAGILNPQKDRSHFHLIYLSRHWKGLDVFKDAEKKSMEEMERLRAQVEQDKRRSKTRQLELYDAANAPESEYYRSLRNRYLALARDDLFTLLVSQGRVKYEDACNRWLHFPLIWENDLKDLIKQSSDICVEGMVPKQRVPKRGKNNYLILVEP